MFYNDIKLSKLGITVDHTSTQLKLMSMIHENDIHINRIEYKVEKLSMLGIDVNYPFYEIRISDNVNPLRMIIFFDDMRIKFSLLDYYMINDLELKNFSIYREKNLVAINQIDSIPMDSIRPHDLKILIDNLKSVSLINGMYTDSEYIENLSANNIKLILIGYFKNCLI